ncbi:MAG TPA: DNA-directed RNA polymerase subunit beta [Victivallales bacterium]|nr:DNA-directed RNA polymerase subunit beta [Victivallales bacterium]
MAERINFGRLNEVLEMPDLIGIQVDSFKDFLQLNVKPQERKNSGLQAIFKEIFPIESFDQQISVDFISYRLSEPKMDPIDCVKDGETYGSGLYVTLALNIKGKKIEEEVYFGDFPMMTERGSFIINGAERVIVSQLHRSPGICFERTRHSSGKAIYSFRIIPDRGSWLEVQFDIINDLIFIYLDKKRRRRKFLITTFLRAIGYDTTKELVSSVYETKDYSVSELLKKTDEELKRLYLVDFESINKVDILEILQPYEPLTAKKIKKIAEFKVDKLTISKVEEGMEAFMYCLSKDNTTSEEEALKEVYRRMRPGDPPSLQNAKILVKRLFFDEKRYDLGEVGRFKLNQRLGHNLPTSMRVLDKRDLMEATKYLIKLRASMGQPDDIDHLGSRRIRTVGELVQNQCRVGLLRVERYIREKMTLLGTDEASVTPTKLVNPKSFMTVVKDFFARNQLSQFMDQTNPLAETTNKRRLSALGPGGLNRERAGFEVRDVHTSHYGRVCPIETPEGPNIGLISSLSLYARCNKFGFIETPYRKVKNGIVTNEIDYLTADEEENFVIAQANAPLNMRDENGKLVDPKKKENEFLNPMVMARYKGDSSEMPASKIQYMDVSPKQLVSAAAALVPFLEHNDANRALMGANMQRQAVPLMKTEAPIIGTGIEKKIAMDSRSVLVSDVAGEVVSVTGDKIVIAPKDGDFEHVYTLKKFLRTNNGTSINQRPIVVKGQKVKKGQVIADSSSTESGELALGKNVLVAFMPWCGYNFEDAIVISEKLVKEDVFTSIHIDEFEITARDTKLGPEEITRDIPNVSEEALRNLGQDGIVRLGAEVKPGDILVGKITPKSETELAPEERLLKAIFGDKASDVKDTSLVVPSGKGGIVMEIRIERDKDPNRQNMTKAEKKRQIKLIKESFKAELNEIIQEIVDKLSEFMLESKLPHPIYDKNASKGKTLLISANRKITRSTILKLANKYDSYEMKHCPIKEKIDRVMSEFVPKIKNLIQTRDENIKLLEKGEGEYLGMPRRVKIYIASKRKLEVGDKMAGRHGNKGIVAKIVPVEDMPFLPDGTPVDIVLNPLGVPSRMNVGQVLETHLGWAAKILGLKIASPVFDGVSEEKIVELMKKANEKYEKENGINYHFGFKQKGNELLYDGKTELYDGRTGEKFAHRVTVGYIYMMKLDHLVSNKIHARAVGPYSLVTQQPLGGKAQHGGQRFGEMEVWALEAYGAAHTLQEILTVKSDDVIGRAKIYESIVKGQCVLEPHRPESFNVLVKEMQSLSLDVRVVNKKNISE